MSSQAVPRTPLRVAKKPKRDIPATTVGQISLDEHAEPIEVQHVPKVEGEPKRKVPFHELDENCPPPCLKTPSIHVETTMDKWSVKKVRLNLSGSKVTNCSLFLKSVGNPHLQLHLVCNNETKFGSLSNLAEGDCIIVRSYKVNSTYVTMFADYGEHTTVERCDAPGSPEF